MVKRVTQTSRGIIVRHKEYQGDVSSSGTTFAVVKNITLNCCSPTTFPWLSQLACMYQRYRVRNLSVMYSSEQPTTATGVVIVSSTDNCMATAPLGKQQILESSDAFKVNVWQPGMKAIRVSPDWKLCAYGDTAAPGYTATYASQTLGQNANDYAVGRLYVAVNGVSSGVVGEIYLSYTVELVDSAPLQLPPQVTHHIEITSCGATTPFDTLGSINNKGTLAITFPTSTTMTTLLPGPVFIAIGAATDGTATASVSVSADVGTLTAVNSGVQGGGFSAIYTWTHTTYPVTVTFTASSFTHLAPSTSYPVRIYLMSYDNLNMKMAQP